ncbi:MAG: AAA family ATPase [Chlorobi bacterium]|nr:MAG: recombination protein F [Chlorobi bacterium OLB7]MBK8910204.1 AAA family ATPase [Chlorobiota bacterium]
MSFLHRNLTQIWDQLRSKKNQSQDFLEELRIEKLRGIRDLRVPFSFPVSVIAGPNGSGKSTVLFACACAYRPPSKTWGIVPSKLFPNLQTQGSASPSDKSTGTVFEYYYLSNSTKTRMRWAKGKTWNKSFLGKREGIQPERHTYIRTLSNLTNPSEVRSILQMGKSTFTQEELTADLIAFAHRILPVRYRGLTLLKRRDNKDLLFAVRENDEESYSEFHMSAGERAILRISKDISQMNDSLVLIDEVEAGLHPVTQQQMMLELQRLALRNNLQIIVTTHSSVVIESVPQDARIFLDRTENNVVIQTPYRDIIQKALYGRSLNKLSILCEDDVAEGVIMGVLDVLNPRIGIAPDDITVGRDTGKDQFGQHIEALAKFQTLDSFVFILDGDARNLENSLRSVGARHGHAISLLFLPSNQSPEVWLWSILTAKCDDYATVLGTTVEDLQRKIQLIDQIYSGASDKPTNINKNKLETLAEELNRTVPQIARLVAAGESQSHKGEMKVFVDELSDAIIAWRNRY